MTETKVDFLNAGGERQGEVAAALNHQIDPAFYRPFIDEASGKSLVSVYKGAGDRKDPKSYKTIQTNTNGVLRREEWQQLDAAIIPASESRLNGIQSLIARGLVYNLGNAMGTTVLETHDQSDAFEAELTMDGVTRTKGDRLEFGAVYLPLPIIHVDYEINSRVLEASRRLGNPLDTSSAERAARKVSEKLEQMLFSNAKYSFGGGTIHSYLNFPHRNTLTILPWTDTGVTGRNIVDMVLGMKQASINNLHYGPWELYIPTAYETLLDEDYDTSGASTQTIRERILKIAGLLDVKVIDTLPVNNVVLVQMSVNTVRLVRGMGITNVQWSTQGNMLHQYKVMTIQVPQIRADHNQKSGIVHASG